MKLRVTEQARADIDDVWAFVARDDPHAADRLLTRVEAVLDRLRDFPMSGRPGQVPGTREAVVPGTPFFVAYRVANDAVEILAIVHGARRWPP